MKPQTLERYIRQTDISYPTLIDRCLKGGWIKEHDFIEHDGQDSWRNVKLVHTLTGNAWCVAIDCMDGRTALFNSYTWNR